MRQRWTSGCDVQLSVCFQDANAAVLKFFQDLMETGIKREDEPSHETRRRLVSNILDTHGQTLVNNLVTAAVFILPAYMQQDVAETFYQVCLVPFSSRLSSG